MFFFVVTAVKNGPAIKGPKAGEWEANEVVPDVIDIAPLNTMTVASFIKFLLNFKLYHS